MHPMLRTFQLMEHFGLRIFRLGMLNYNFSPPLPFHCLKNINSETKKRKEKNTHTHTHTHIKGLILFEEEFESLASWLSRCFFVNSCQLLSVSPNV